MLLKNNNIKDYNNVQEMGQKSGTKFTKKYQKLPKMINDKCGWKVTNSGLLPVLFQELRVSIWSMYKAEFVETKK